MKNLTALFFLLAAAIPCFGADSRFALLETAENSFISGNYQKAIEIYETLAQIEKINDPDIYYNLSNAYYRNGELGRAVLNIERAFLLKPRDKDIRHNRNFLSMKAGAAQEKGFDGFLSAADGIASLNTVSVLFFFTGASVLILLSFYMVKRKKQFKNAALILFIFLAALSVLAAVKIKNEIIDVKAAVLKSVSVRSGPGENNPEVFKLPEGRIVLVFGEKSGWNHIKIYPEAYSGWIQSSDIEKING
jgi:tetratricopeptide (TPR) repeat protein